MLILGGGSYNTTGMAGKEEPEDDPRRNPIFAFAPSSAYRTYPEGANRLTCYPQVQLSYRYAR